MWSTYTCAGMGGVGRSPPDDPVKPPATALAGAANWTALDSSGIVPVKQNRIITDRSKQAPTAVILVKPGYITNNTRKSTRREFSWCNKYKFGAEHVLQYTQNKEKNVKHVYMLHVYFLDFIS